MKISIIVPVYNVEKYIDYCIKSILAQTFEDFELILIDDGSTDNSYKICQAYSKYNNIKLFKKENGGVSSARNYGIDHASGKYITFIDSDDFVAPDYLEKLNASALTNTEFVFSGIINYDSNEKKDIINLKNYSWDLFQENDFLNFLQQPLQTSPCAKLYLRSIIEKNNLKFDNSLSYAEDKDFNLNFFRYISNAVSISYSGYFYRRDVLDSLSKQFHEKVFQYKCIHWNIKHEICLNRNFNSEHTHTILVNELFNIINDEIVILAKKHSSLLHFNKELKSIVDFNYLRKWSKRIQAPTWKKTLILNKAFAVIVLLYKTLGYVKKKG